VHSTHQKSICQSNSVSGHTYWSDGGSHEHEHVSQILLFTTLEIEMV